MGLLKEVTEGIKAGRPYLVLQKTATPIILIGEVRDDYEKVLSDRDKIKACMLKTLTTEVDGKRFKPVFVFIVKIDAESFGKFANRVLTKENELVKETINDLEPSNTDRLVIISCKPRTILNFSDNFDPKLRKYFEAIL